MLPYGANIDYSTNIISFSQLGGLTVDFEVTRRANPCVRKVQNRAKVTLQPGEQVYLAAHWKPLPDDRCFAFHSSNPVVFNAAVDGKTLPKVLAVNNTDEPITIPRKAKLGYIKEADDSSYFTCSFKGAMKALACAVAIATPIVTGAPTGTNPGGTDVAATTPATPVNTDFTLTPEVRQTAVEAPLLPDFTAIATDSVTQTDIAITDPSSQTPLTDAVFNIIQPEDTAGIQPEEPIQTPSASRPRVTPTHAALGIKKPSDIEEHITRDGVHVGAEDPRFVKEVEKLLYKYHDIFVNTEPIDVPEDQQLKIPLVEGWQKMKLASRGYPLSRKDRAFLDEHHEKLYEKGRFEQALEPSPFASAMFVVWRKVHGEEKGRVVVDLRPLNKVAIPDNYPLLLQADVILALRGKLFITIINVTGFFHQFLVHPAFRDHFTMISHRGLERSKVALMGFRNSPAYAQRFMDRLLKGHQDYCRAFIDDIVIFSDN